MQFTEEESEVIWRDLQSILITEETALLAAWNRNDLEAVEEHSILVGYYRHELEKFKDLGVLNVKSIVAGFCRIN